MATIADRIRGIQQSLQTINNEISEESNTGRFDRVNVLKNTRNQLNDQLNHLFSQQQQSLQEEDYLPPHLVVPNGGSGSGSANISVSVDGSTKPYASRPVSMQNRFSNQHNQYMPYNPSSRYY